MQFIFNDPKLKSKRRNLRNNMPEPERRLWYYLRSKNLSGYKFRRQHSVGNYILDFYCPELQLAIEIDGDSHFSPAAMAYDKTRGIFLSSHGIKTLRFTNTEIMENIESVLDRVTNYLPSPLLI